MKKEGSYCDYAKISQIRCARDFAPCDGARDREEDIRRWDFVEARQELSRLAVMVHCYSGAEGARYLGVTNSCITRLLSLRIN